MLAYLFVNGFCCVGHPRTRDQFGIILEKLWGHFGIGLAYGGFDVILGPLWAYKRRMAGMMHVVAGLMVSLSAPRGLINSKHAFLCGYAT